MKKIYLELLFRMDRFEEGFEKFQETKEKLKGEVKDRIKDVKGGDIKTL